MQLLFFYCLSHSLFLISPLYLIRTRLFSARRTPWREWLLCLQPDARWGRLLCFWNTVRLQNVTTFLSILGILCSNPTRWRKVSIRNVFFPFDLCWYLSVTSSCFEYVPASLSPGTQPLLPSLWFCLKTDGRGLMRRSGEQQAVSSSDFPLVHPQMDWK